MQPNLQRLLPILLIVFLLLIVLPTLLHHSSSKGLTSGELSTQTIDAMSTVDRTEQAFKVAHHGYTRHVADLITLDRGLAKALGDGVQVTLDASTTGKTYYAQVASTVIALFRSRVGNQVVLRSCIVVKSGSGVKCPSGYTTPGNTTTTTTTTGTATTATTSTTG
jgi:hypothetical protein